METVSDFIALAATFVPALITVAVVIIVLNLANRSLRRKWEKRPDAQFRFQLIMLALTLAGIIAFIISLPMEDAVRGQLLSLIGILLSATIALSSTTFMGNIMAGVMLKVIRSARPGDFVTLGDLTGRITEMDLLHTEIQTEFRDLVTVPNLHMVTQPVKVVRASGTIISTEVSIGYDVPHTRVREALCTAAASCGLKDGFAQVRELGDFSISYRVAGMLEDVTSLISARSALRSATLDALHSAGIEIVSPTFMNTRALERGTRIIPREDRANQDVESSRVEDIAFDKASEASSVEQLRRAVERIESEVVTLKKDDAEPEPVLLARLEARRDALAKRLAEAEERHRAADLDD